MKDKGQEPEIWKQEITDWKAKSKERRGHKGRRNRKKSYRRKIQVWD